ncbi:hypothetical protein RvY_07814 [Ramazzottius varieornatus]|uniref:USP domain-containing protein n=1 Tax=Ramazzottius varieornatus TaxID=947166 RepID=A0A1D1V6G3_RAMVA|nr:hypothetical protein RvY_07814 [Ramazzottius varieornatus]
MPAAGKKKAWNAQQIKGKKRPALIEDAADLDNDTTATTKGRTRAAAKAATNPVRSSKQGIICPHVPKALLDGADMEFYSEIIDKFVVPSSKTLIPWDPTQSRKMSPCEGGGCAQPVEFVCCHCKQRFCRKMMKEHATNIEHSCAISAECGYVACFTCGELLVQVDKCMKQWRSLHLTAVYDTALRYGWIPNVKQLTCFFPEPLQEGCARSPLVGVHGIVNLSNTCCLSVILQALCHTPLFRDFCLARLHRCTPNSLHFDRNCVMCAFTSVIFDLYILPAGQCYAPQTIFQAVQNSLYSNGSELGEQQDPAEILNLLLSDMHLNAEKDGRKFSEILIRKLHLHDRQAAFLCVDHGVYCSCIVCDLFTGVEEFTTTCLKCRQGRVQGNSFKLLMLPIGEEKRREPQVLPRTEDLSLEDCLRMYTMENFTCEIKNECCVNFPGANRTNRFRHLPVVLIIQLKRAVAKTAKAKPRDGDFKKNRDHIQFPVNLDMTKYMAPEHTGATKYTLYGVIVHKGTKLSSGHYVIYLKHMSGRWLCIDDRAVFCFPEAHVLALQAYMLFYVHDAVQFTVDMPKTVQPSAEENPEVTPEQDTSLDGTDEFFISAISLTDHTYTAPVPGVRGAEETTNSQIL